MTDFLDALVPLVALAIVAVAIGLPLLGGDRFNRLMGDDR